MQEASHNNSHNGQDVIQTLRTAHQNQTQLNLMADQKANILIGTLVLVFTVIITRFLSVLDNHPDGLLPLVVFMLMQLVPLTLTVMVLVPRNIHAQRPEHISQMPNPLFFGMFTRYSEQQYLQHMNHLLTDQEAARRLLITDIYQMGQVLRRKYGLLQWAYLSALAGVVIPVVIGLMTVL